MPSFPVSSQRVYNHFFTKAFTVIGAALMKQVAPVPPAVSFSTASNPIRNDDTRKYIMTSNSAQTLTIPKNLTNIAIGEEVVITTTGTGVTTVAAASQVTINKIAATLKSNGQYSVIRLVKTAANVWTATGDLSAT